jgi:hypothetical protein
MSVIKDLLKRIHQESDLKYQYLRGKYEGNNTHEEAIEGLQDFAEEYINLTSRIKSLEQGMMGEEE